MITGLLAVIGFFIIAAAVSGQHATLRDIGFLFGAAFLAIVAFFVLITH